jgi:hypothetical protein
MNIAISLEGVLCDATGDLIQKGLVVYRSFKGMGRVVLVTDMPRQRAEGWLLINNIAGYDDLIDNSVTVDPDQPLRERQLDVLLSKGPLTLMVDGDAECAAVALKKGVASLLFSDSVYSHYKFRPDVAKTVRPWDEVVAERARQQALLATDKRTTAAEMGLWD